MCIRDRSYIVIQRIRFDETLDYRLAVEADELKDVLIPKDVYKRQNLTC